MKIVGKISNSPLLRISSLNGFSVILKIAIGFVTSKVIAVFIGPSGMALVGNFRNFMTSVEAVTTLGFQNGVIKYVAESKQDHDRLKKLLSTIFFCLVASTVISAVVFFVLSDQLSVEIFVGNIQFASIFKIASVALPFFVGGVFLMSVVNGLGEFKSVIYLNIVGNVIGLFVSILLIWRYNTFGALLALVISPALLFFVSWWFLARKLNIGRLISISAFDLPTLKNLSSFSIMTLFSAVAVPMTYLSIRQTAIENLGFDAAGNWEAINRISSYYLLFVTTLLTVYFLPKMVVAAKSDLRSIFMSYFKTILPVFGVLLLLVYVLRFFVIGTLFTKEFLPAQELFAWQLAGDFFKAASMVLGYCFFAKKLTKAFVLTELFSLVILYFSSHFFMDRFGIKGLAIAHLVTYATYFVVLAVYFRKVLFFKNP